MHDLSTWPKGLFQRAAGPPQNTILTQTPSLSRAPEDRPQPATSCDYGEFFSPWILSLTVTSTLTEEDRKNLQTSIKPYPSISSWGGPGRTTQASTIANAVMTICPSARMPCGPRALDFTTGGAVEDSGFMDALVPGGQVLPRGDEPHS